MLESPCYQSTLTKTRPKIHSKIQEINHKTVQSSKLRPSVSIRLLAATMDVNECPTDLRSTFLSCILDALFGDTPIAGKIVEHHDVYKELLAQLTKCL